MTSFLSSGSQFIDAAFRLFDPPRVFWFVASLDRRGKGAELLAKFLQRLVGLSQPGKYDPELSGFALQQFRFFDAPGDFRVVQKLQRGFETNLRILFKGFDDGNERLDRCGGFLGGLLLPLHDRIEPRWYKPSACSYSASAF